jgi:hypothetical protein
MLCIRRGPGAELSYDVSRSPLPRINREDVREVTLVSCGHSITIPASPINVHTLSVCRSATSSLNKNDFALHRQNLMAALAHHLPFLA